MGRTRSRMMKRSKDRHVDVDTDISESGILRRYVDLPRYLDLLRTSSLYLRRVDLFPDKLEGVLTPGIRAAMDEGYDSGKSLYNADKFSAKVRAGVYLSCWSAGAHDNMALWQLYSSPALGLVITTTGGRLIETALNWSTKEIVEIFKVRYIDHLDDPDMIIGRYTDPLHFKHSAYLFENEVRAVISRVGTRKPRPEGLNLAVDLQRLVRSVVLAPDAPAWFVDLVADVSQKYGLTAPIRRSMLAFVQAGKSPRTSASISRIA